MKRAKWHRQPPPQSVQQSKCLISASLICRNESSRLPAAVMAARRFADEVVVADTGSTDDTAALAAKLGCRVVHHRWVHHYAAARNASLAACRGRYVCWLDPDEEVPAEDAPKLRALAASGSYDEIRCPTYLNSSYRPAEEDLPGYGPGFVVLKPRMMRRCADVRWRFRIHEDLAWSRAITRLDADVRVFNHGQAGGKGTEDYYFALMVLGHREEPNEPHYSLYLAEVALVRDHDVAKAQEYLASVDPSRLGGKEQQEKYHLLDARTHRVETIMAIERNDTDTAQAAGDLAMAAYGRAHQIAGRSRAPLEAATLLLHAGERARFDQLVGAVMKDHPDDLQAQMLARLGELEPDPMKLSVHVNAYLAGNQGRTPQEAFASVVGAAGRHTGPVNVRIVIPARCREDAPLRRRNLECCLSRLQIATEHLATVWPDRERNVGVVLVEQDVPSRLAACASILPSFPILHRPVLEAGPFNRGFCLNAGAEDGPELLCLMDGDLWVADDWLKRCLDFIAGWRHAELWKGAMLPYNSAHYLSPEASEAVCAGRPPSRHLPQTVYASVGGALWIERELFARVGGYDPAYQGWGVEDNDLDRRLRGAIGPLLRVPMPLWHLFHEEPDKSGAQANLNRLAAKETT
jgi:glycosyltransferase involved in cell wall biosynthesis